MIHIPSGQQSGSHTGSFEKPCFCLATHTVLHWLGEKLVSRNGVIFSTLLVMQGIFPERAVWHWSSLPGSVRVFFTSGSAGAHWFWMWLCRWFWSPFRGISNLAVTSALLPETGKTKTLMVCIPLKLSLSILQQEGGC